MSNLTLTIPHSLGRAEARRRIESELSHARQQHGSKLSRLEERWEGDTLHFVVGALGQTVTGRVMVEDAQVHAEIALPWMLALLAKPFVKRIEDQGRQLLGSH